MQQEQFIAKYKQGITNATSEFLHTMDGDLELESPNDLHAIECIMQALVERVIDDFGYDNFKAVMRDVESHGARYWEV